LAAVTLTKHPATINAAEVAALIDPKAHNDGRRRVALIRSPEVDITH
jgi:hypothetical protein